MDFPTFVYRRFLRSRGTRTVWSFLRKRLISLAGDPACTVEVHGRDLRLPLSHALPIYLKKYRHYDRLPRRLSVFVHARQNRLTCIDVGANIGDTVAAFWLGDADRFLAIEPNPGFHRFLVANWGEEAAVTILAVLCAAERKTVAVDIKESCGTSTLHETAMGLRVEKRSLDDLVAEHPDFARPDILKIDTDGHDFDVIAGAHTLIKTQRPAVLFECDAFGSETYIDDCQEAISFFHRAGYRHLLLYDNFGGLMGRHALADSAAFRDLLFYQLTSDFHYFDILIMRDEDLMPFLESERAHFVEAVLEETLRRAASTAAQPTPPATTDAAPSCANTLFALTLHGERSA